MLRTVTIAAALLGAATVAQANEPAKPNADYGKTVSIIGGCNDCHTADYSEKGGGDQSGHRRSPATRSATRGRGARATR